jgi:hypothetical protein
MMGQDETPSPLPREIEALVQHERVLVDKPEILRARLVARARESIRVEAALPESAGASGVTRTIWYAAAALLILEVVHPVLARTG